MRLKTLLAVLSFVVVTLPSAPALATTNSLLWQGMTFEIMSSGNQLTLNIYDALNGGTGNWTDVQYLSAIEFRDYGGTITSAQVTSTNTGVIWTSSTGGVNSSGTGCEGSGTSFDCFVASTPASLTDFMTWTILFSGTNLDWDLPSLRLSFLTNATDTQPTGDHLSRPIPVTPVPEPEIYAMMGVGLGLLGWIGRRKKRQAAA